MVRRGPSGTRPPLSRTPSSVSRPVSTLECEVRGGDLGGFADHIVARVGSLASLDDVLVMGTVRPCRWLGHQIRGGRCEHQWSDEHQLKGVPGSWALRHHPTMTPGTSHALGTRARENDSRSMRVSPGSVFGAPTAQLAQTFGRESATRIPAGSGSEGACEHISRISRVRSNPDIPFAPATLGCAHVLRNPRLWDRPAGLFWLIRDSGALLSATPPGSATEFTSGEPVHRSHFFK